MQALLRGPGCLKNAPAWLQENFPSARRILVLHSPTVGSRNPGRHFLESIQERFSAHIVAVQGDLHVGPDPFDLLITLGGGTLIDAGKCLLKERGTVPHVAIPTTAGTGSEATAFAAVYARGVKQSIEAAELLPQGTILDPELLASLPLEPAAHAFFDAIAQAIESYWSNRSTTESRLISLEALSNLWAHADPYLLHRNPIACEKVQWGAHLSGQAIQIARTTMAHSLSYPLTGRLGVPHGLAVGLMLPIVLIFNSQVTPRDCLHPVGYEAFQALLAQLWRALGCTSAETAATALRAKLQSAGISPNLLHCGVTRDFLPQLIQEALASTRAGNNPRQPLAMPLLEMLEYETQDG